MAEAGNGEETIYTSGGGSLTSMKNGREIMGNKRRARPEWVTQSSGSEPNQPRTLETSEPCKGFNKFC